MRNMCLMLLALILVPCLSIIVFPLNLIRKIFLKQSISSYFKTIAIGLDQLGGSVLYSQEDWTISSYTYFLCFYKKNKYACWFMKFIDFLFGKDHCKNSYNNEKIEFKTYTEVYL